jgi:hypothetical protein
LIRLAIYCRSCLRFLEHGREAGPCPIPEWVEKCDWCAERELERQAERERRERMWAPRICAAPDCDVLFAPSAPKQVFHSDQCRKRAHWQTKAQLARSNGRVELTSLPN